MKWLLITAVENPGDAFARIGCMKLIEAVDAAPQFMLWNKEGNWPVPQYDRAVVCGMPLFWSHEHTGNWTAPWWGVLCDMAKKKPMLCHGVGSCISVKNGPSQRDKMKESAHGLASIATITVRDSYVNPNCETPFPVVSCPSVFACETGLPKDRDLCNMIPHGGHYPFMDFDEAKRLSSRAFDIAKPMIEEGRIFMAHSQNEADYAMYLGFRKIVTWMGDPHHLLWHYARCRDYFGYRIHGAIPVIGAGGKAQVAGLDTRADSVLVASKLGREWDRQVAIFQHFKETGK